MTNRVLFSNTDKTNIWRVLSINKQLRSRAAAFSKFCVAFQPKNAKRLLQERSQYRDQRDRAVGLLRQAVECIDGLQADFVGCTDDASDPDRLHEWDDTISDRFDWMDDADPFLSSLEQKGEG